MSIKALATQLNVSIFNESPNNYCVFRPEFHSTFIFDDTAPLNTQLHTLWHAIVWRLKVVGYDVKVVCPFEGKTAIYKGKDQFFNLEE